MKKVTAVFFLLLTFISCDCAYRLQTDKGTTYNISCDCGIVKIAGVSALSDHFYVLLDGNFTINFDSLKIDHVNSTSETEVWSYLDNQSLDNFTSVTMNGKNLFCFTINRALPLQYASHNGKGTIKIYPSNFITCNGSPVIMDTITFTVMNDKKGKGLIIGNKNSVEFE